MKTVSAGATKAASQNCRRVPEKRNIFVVGQVLQSQVSQHRGRSWRQVILSRIAQLRACKRNGTPPLGLGWRSPDSHFPGGSIDADHRLLGFSCHRQAFTIMREVWSTRPSGEYPKCEYRSPIGQSSQFQRMSLAILKLDLVFEDITLC